MISEVWTTWEEPWSFAQGGHKVGLGGLTVGGGKRKIPLIGHRKLANTEDVD